MMAVVRDRGIASRAPSRPRSGGTPPRAPLPLPLLLAAAEPPTVDGPAGASAAAKTSVCTAIDREAIPRPEGIILAARGRVMLPF